jgi:UDP-glucose 4-epimerase
MKDLEGLKVVVTGGTGFIGSHLVERLVREGMDVKVLIRSKSRAENLKEVLSNIEMIKCDFQDIPEIKKSLDDAEYLFHLAARVPFSKHELYTGASSILDIADTANIAKIAVAKEIERIVYMSGIVVYGIPQYIPISEEHPTNPTTFYGASKLSGENYLKIYAKEKSLPTVILRASSVFGPRQISMGVIAEGIKRVVQHHKPPIVYGTGRDKRDYVYVDDVIDACILAITKGEGVYNIGSGLSYSILDIANKIINLAKADIGIEFKEGGSDIHDNRLDISCATKELGYHPKVSIEEGLKRQLQWYLDKKA